MPKLPGNNVSGDMHHPPTVNHPYCEFPKTMVFPNGQTYPVASKHEEEMVTRARVAQVEGKRDAPAEAVVSEVMSDYARGGRRYR